MPYRAVLDVFCVPGTRRTRVAWRAAAAPAAPTCTALPAAALRALPSAGACCAACRRRAYGRTRLVPSRNYVSVHRILPLLPRGGRGLVTPSMYTPVDRLDVPRCNTSVSVAATCRRHFPLTVSMHTHPPGGTCLICPPPHPLACASGYTPPLPLPHTATIHLWDKPRAPTHLLMGMAFSLCHGHH